jgi:hypothetical protein
VLTSDLQHLETADELCKNFKNQNKREISVSSELFERTEALPRVIRNGFVTEDHKPLSIRVDGTTAQKATRMAGQVVGCTVVGAVAGAAVGLAPEAANNVINGVMSAAKGAAREAAKELVPSVTTKVLFTGPLKRTFTNEGKTTEQIIGDHFETPLAQKIEGAVKEAALAKVTDPNSYTNVDTKKVVKSTIIGAGCGTAAGLVFGAYGWKTPIRPAVEIRHINGPDKPRTDVLIKPKNHSPYNNRRDDI